MLFPSSKDALEKAILQEQLALVQTSWARTVVRSHLSLSYYTRRIPRVPANAHYASPS